MSDMESSPKITVKKDDHYRDVIVNGVFGGHRPGFFEAIVYTDEMIADDALSTLATDPRKVHIQRVIQCRLIIDPVQAKSIARWFNKHIEAYEKAFGKIVMPEEVRESSEENVLRKNTRDQVV